MYGYTYIGIKSPLIVSQNRLMNNLVRQKRKEKGLSLRALSRLSKIYVSDLSQIERGLIRAFPAWRTRIAEALEMSEDSLFPEESPVV